MGNQDTQPKQVGILYDIGCTLEKGMIKVRGSLMSQFIVLHKSFANHFLFTQRNIFEHERAQGQLKFGTSVFHAYVHNWGCQLEYNPG